MRLTIPAPRCRRLSATIALTVLLPIAAFAAPSDDGTSRRPAADRPAPSDVRADAPRAPAAPDAGPPVDISPAVIRKAIADSKDVMDDVVPAAPSTFGSGPETGRQRIDRAFDEAEIPTCLTPDAFKFAPPMIGPFAFRGLLALPFWVNSIATGKCRH